MEKKEGRGFVRIEGKEYPCEFVDGVLYVGGMTVYEFVNTLDVDTILNLIKIGETAIEFEKAGIKFPAQKTLECLEKSNKKEMN